MLTSGIKRIILRIVKVVIQQKFAHVRSAAPKLSMADRLCETPLWLPVCRQGSRRGFSQDTPRTRCPDRFSGGAESNGFLRRRGFDVVECDCGGSVRDGRVTSVSGPSERKRHMIASTRHSERCPECKMRVGQLLERIYGACVLDHRFRWQTGLTAYAGTSIDPVLRDVAEVLEGYRGYGIGTFVRSSVLAGCDYWVPDPGFVVEFDESQHFTSPRKLALSVYADAHPLGFGARRWLDLCEHHDATDNAPPFRDEQRAWYDTLRDLVPSIKGLQPTVRLYARDWAWCSLDPDSREDRERFSDLIHEERSPSSRTTVEIRSAE